jgi:hypothetical protein
MGKGEQERRDETISNCHQTQQLHAKNNTETIKYIINMTEGNVVSTQVNATLFLNEPFTNYTYTMDT